MERRRPALRCVGCGRGPASGTLRQASSLLLARAVARPTVSQSHCWISRVGNASHVVPISRCHSTFEQIPESREISTERAFSINPPRHVLSRFVLSFCGSSPLGDRGRGRRRALKRAASAPAGDRRPQPRCGPAKRDAMCRAVRSKGVTLRMFWRFVSALISQQHKCSVRGPMSSGNNPFLIE